MKPEDETERHEALLAVVGELSAVGATVLARVEGHHAVMADPEGNEFCVAFEAVGRGTSA